MIVNYLNIFGMPLNPSETYSKLVVNPNAMLPSAFAFE
jgi:hypothetical protein